MKYLIAVALVSLGLSTAALSADRPQTDLPDQPCRDRYKWVTFAVGIICFAAGFWRSYTYLHYDAGIPA